MVEKTGIQMIEELLGGQVVLDRRIQVVEQLLKQLLATSNSVASTGCCVEPTKVENVSVKPTIKEGVPEPLIRAAPNARVVGRIVEGGKPVPEVNITIYDDRNNAIKKTRTNRSGEWMAQLPPGKFAAECVLEGRINGNVVFTVGLKDKIVRVGQPT
jgi:hypothetical protein